VLPSKSLHVGFVGLGQLPQVGVTPVKSPKAAAIQNHRKRFMRFLSRKTSSLSNPNLAHQAIFKSSLRSRKQWLKTKFAISGILAYISVR
jgi:hypothetical protein